MKVPSDGMFKFTIITTFIIGAICSPVLSYAEVYRWVDEAGKVHFSDKPISDKAETVDINVTPSVPETPLAREERKQKAEKYLRARKEERAEIDKKQKEKKRLAAERKKNCAAAKKEYKRVTEASAVYFKNKDGTRDWLEPKRRKKEELAIKAEIKKWCK